MVPLGGGPLRPPPMGDTELDMPWEVGLKLDGPGHSSSCL